MESPEEAAVSEPDQERLHYCAAPPRTMPVLSPSISFDRQRAIVLTRAKWANGTTLRYCFTGGPDDQRAVVRSCFEEWKGLGIGLTFTEVTQPAEAEVRDRLRAGGRVVVLPRP